MARKLLETFQNRLINIRNYDDKYPTLRELRGKIIIRGTGSVKIHKQVLELEKTNRLEELSSFEEQASDLSDE